MSTIHVLVGQCGNQLGTSFLDELSSDALDSNSEQYQTQVSATHFRPALNGRGRIGSNNAAKKLPEPRCVLVDMEPKVIAESIARVNSSDTTHAYRLAPQQCVTRGEGSGNNWAYGYLHQGESRRDEIVECLRRECECDESRTATIHVVHSLAGGTGSGVSCLVADAARELLPRAQILHTAVWPNDCGEVATQWYNVLLSTATLRSSADAVFTVFNEEVQSKIADARSGRSLATAQVTSISYSEMNHYISQLMLPLHVPHSLYGMQLGGACPSVGPFLRRSRTGDVIEAVALDPLQKFFSGIAFPTLGSSSQPTVATVASEAARTLRALVAPRTWQTFDCLWSLRGRGPREAAAVAELSHHFKSVIASAAENADVTSSGSRETPPFPAAYFIPSSLLLNTSDVMATHRLVPGGTKPVPCGLHLNAYGAFPHLGERLETALRKVEELVQVGAYLHHFERYGVTRDDILDAAGCMWETSAAYLS